MDFEQLLINLGLCFVPLMAAMNPLSKVPIFAGMSAGLTPRRVQVLVRQAILASFAVSATFALVGTYIFRLLAIQPADFQIGGGLLLFALSLAELLSPRKWATDEVEDAGVFPLAIPLIAGPAVLTTTVLMVDRFGLGVTMIALVLNLLLTWLMLRGANFLATRLGRAALLGVAKVMMILLAAIGVMLVRLGITTLLGHAPAAP